MEKEQRLWRKNKLDKSNADVRTCPDIRETRNKGKVLKSEMEERTLKI